MTKGMEIISAAYERHVGTYGAEVLYLRQSPDKIAAAIDAAIAEVAKVTAERVMKIMIDTWSMKHGHAIGANEVVREFGLGGA